ncbi:uncharacterized protein LOC111347858 [Spodoptera litura]|uniref:Uncharacterized protein LOC111347858 n=1 Tax=Spodoptera litura TaxID=69820 RepID=A0A9J7DPS6_SPOLT|nr:uncharacterized protein LOC111347858 [Spodoptera litura]
MCQRNRQVPKIAEMLLQGTTMHQWKMRRMQALFSGWQVRQLRVQVPKTNSLLEVAAGARSHCRARPSGAAPAPPPLPYSLHIPPINLSLNHTLPPRCLTTGTRTMRREPSRPSSPRRRWTCTHTTQRTTRPGRRTWRPAPRKRPILVSRAAYPTRRRIQ